MIIKEYLLAAVPPICWVGHVIRVNVFSFFKWYIYFIVERKPTKLTPGIVKDLDDVWKAEFKAMRKKPKNIIERKK